jgi:hypothetical protein
MSDQSLQQLLITNFGLLPSGYTGSQGVTGYTGSIGTGGGGGATGGGNNKVFYENDQTVTDNYTITSGKNAMTAGPVSIDTGVVVTVPTGSTWVIV